MVNIGKEANRAKEKEVTKTPSPSHPQRASPSPSSILKTSPSLSRPWFDLATMNGVELIFNSKGIIRTFFSEETKTHHDQEAFLLSTSGSSSSSFDKHSNSSNNIKKGEAENHSHSHARTHAHTHTPTRSNKAKSSPTFNEPSNPLFPSPSSATQSFSFDQGDGDADGDGERYENTSIIHFDSDSDCDTSNYYIGSSSRSSPNERINCISNRTSISEGASLSATPDETEVNTAQEQRRQQKQQQQQQQRQRDTTIQPNNGYKSMKKYYLKAGSKPERSENDSYQDQDSIQHSNSLNDDKILGSYDISDESLLPSCSSLTSATSTKTTKTDDSSVVRTLFEIESHHCNEHPARSCKWASVSIDKGGPGRKERGSIKTLNSENISNSNSINNKINNSSTCTAGSVRSMRGCRKKSCLLGKTKRPSMIVRAPSSSSVRFKDVKPSIEDHLVRARALLNNAKDLRKRLDVGKPNSTSASSCQNKK